jgi:hypothetical protein
MQLGPGGRRPVFAPAQHGGAADGKNRARMMAGHEATFRLASGIFYAPSPLGHAVGDLLESGFKRREMCLAGTREALAGAQAGPQTAPRQLRPLYPLSGGVEVMGTSGALLRTLLKQASWREGAGKLDSAWLLPELFGRFSDHIRRNAVVLVISAPDPGLLQAGSRILLRHSAHPVQTHEFTLEQAAG